MVTIFTEHITPRLTFVLDFCFKNKGQGYQLYTNQEEWDKLSVKSVAYGQNHHDALLHIPAQGTLYETGIYKGKVVKYEANQGTIDDVADQLSFIFYLISMYDHYVENGLDQHGRIKSIYTTPVKCGFHLKPVVDQIVKKIWEKIGLNYQLVEQQYKCSPSFDIDVAWAYKNRNFIRSAGAALKGKKISQRLKVLLNQEKDPYETYDLIQKIAEKYPVYVFVLLGDWGKYDKNIHWENKAYQTLIKQLRGKATVGIHPSYGSYLNDEQLEKEVFRLNQIIESPVEQSRQHFLKLKIPDTYQQLIDLGITNDFSVGYADNVGFSAGTSFPFPFFDLKKNQLTELMLHPFAYMDSALKDYLKYEVSQALLVVEQLNKRVEEVGGTFQFIWHNSSIHDTGEWKGWQKVLTQTLNLEQ